MELAVAAKPWNRKHALKYLLRPSPLPEMSHPPEIYLPRHIAHIDSWNEGGCVFKVYVIDCNADPDAQPVADHVLASARESVRQLLDALDSEEPWH